MGSKRLYLLDATAFCYRAFYALGGLATSFGQPTNAIYGVTVMLNKILKEKPEYLVACFDVSRETFRQKKFAGYKIQRPPMPDNLVSQVPYIKKIISALGITLLEKEGFEADDIIATAAHKAKIKDFSVTIVSSDKDMLQLVDEGVCVFSPYKDEGVLYDTDKVLERFGVKPDRMTDIVALMGDQADNIPGVPGIGEKTAVDLLKTFGSLENLLKNIEKIQNIKIKEAIRDNLERIKLNKELAVLDENADVDFNLSDLGIKPTDVAELFKIYKHLEFKKFIKDLAIKEEKPQEIKVQVLEERQLQGLISEGEELVLYGDSLKEMVFFTRDKLFKLSEAGSVIRSILADPKIKKIGHDLKKTKISLARDNIALEGLYFDAMIASYVLNSAKSEYNLAEASWDYLGQIEEPQVLDNARAVNLILALKPKLEQQLQEKKLAKLFSDIEMPLIEVLTDMELCGIKLDLEVLKKLSAEIEKKLIKIIEEIYSLSGCQFNINSHKQLWDFLFDKLKLPVVKKTKTGPSTDEEVLRTLASQHKLPALLLDYRQLMKLKNTYIDTLPNMINPDTGRIHASFNQTGTETGRLSSSSPNLQNIPIKADIGKKIRQAIIAYDKDSWLLACDYSQIELRILAHLSGDKNLTRAFEANKDIHKATASLIYGLEEKEVTDSMREVAKRVNFGIVYGLTSFGLSRDLGISQDQAQSFIEAYFLRYPGVKDYIQKQIILAQKEGFVTTILGRRRYIPQINEKNLGVRQFAERQAVNTPIQGSASDLIKLAMIEIHQHLRYSEFRAKMVMQIHDELVFNVPEGELIKITELVRDRMEQVLTLDVPIRVEIKKGKNWLEMEEVI